jgi:hypothetical protein
MSIPSAISQGVQLGVESTYGTGVTADKKLQSLSMRMTPDLAFEQYRPANNKFIAATAITQIQSALDIASSPLNYTELVYPLSSLMGAATISTPGGATLSRNWLFSVNPSAADAAKSFTVQQGDGTTLVEATGVVVNSLDLTIEEGAGASISGNGFGGRLIPAVSVMDTLAGTQPSLLVANWTQASVYIDDVPVDHGDIPTTFGTTKRTAIFSANPSFADRYELIRVLDAALGGSPAAIAEVPVTFQMDMQMAADSFGRGLITAAEDGEPKLIRIELISGTEIESGFPYSMTIDFHAMIGDGGDEDERNGAQAINWTWSAVYNATWNKAVEINIVTGQTAL